MEIGLVPRPFLHPFPLKSPLFPSGLSRGSRWVGPRSSALSPPIPLSNPSVLPWVQTPEMSVNWLQRARSSLFSAYFPPFQVFSSFLVSCGASVGGSTPKPPVLLRNIGFNFSSRASFFGSFPSFHPILLRRCPAELYCRSFSRSIGSFLAYLTPSFPSIFFFMCPCGRPVLPAVGGAGGISPQTPLLISNICCVMSSGAPFKGLPRRVTPPEVTTKNPGA